MPRRAVAVLAAGFLTVSIAYATRYGYGMLLPEMLPDLNISKTQAGFIYAFYFSAYTIGSPVMGLLADRGDMRILLTFFSGLMATGAFLMGLAESISSACLFFTIAGIGHAACWAPVVALVQKWSPEHRRGTALAIATMGSGFGIALWSLTLPWFVAGYGWRAGWFGMGAFGGLVALLNGILIRNPPSVEKISDELSGRSRMPSQSPSSSYWSLFRRRAIWFIGISYLFVGFTVLVPYTYLTSFATERLDMGFDAAARLITAIALFAMAGKLGLGILSDRIGRVRIMILCNLLLGLGCAGLGSATGLYALYISAGLFGLGFGAVWPVYAAAAPDFFDKKASGSVIGIWTFFLGAGSIVSPIVCGWSIDTFGGYRWAFMAGLTASLLSIALLLPAFRPVRYPQTALKPE